MKILILTLLIGATQAVADAPAPPFHLNPELALALHGALDAQSDLPATLPTMPDATDLQRNKVRVQDGPNARSIQAEDQADQHAQEDSAKAHAKSAIDAAKLKAVAAVDKADSAATTAKDQSKSAEAKAKAKAQKSGKGKGGGPD